MEQSVWLRDVRAAQVAREWAGTRTPSHPMPLGTVRWAGEGDTPEEGVTGLPGSRAEGSWYPRQGPPESPLSESPLSEPQRPGHRADPRDPSDWLDRIYGPPVRSSEVPECDLGSFSRPPRRRGVPVHAANDPGRFRDLVQARPTNDDGDPYVTIGGPVRRAAWPVKSLAVPIAVVVGLTGLGVGHTVLEAVGPQDEQIAIADQPLLTGQNGADGVVGSTPRTTASASTGGRHRAESSVTADSTASASSTPGNSSSGQAGYGAATSSSPTGSPSTAGSDADDTAGSGSGTSRRSKRHARHRKSNSKSATCNTNYAIGCVPIASDVDCADSGGDGPAYLSTPAKVVGKDVYQLDSNGDGWACESYRS